MPTELSRYPTLGSILPTEAARIPRFSSKQQIKSFHFVRAEANQTSSVRLLSITDLRCIATWAHDAS